jgi:uncharacterized coiled-coil protein SlyX
MNNNPYFGIPDYPTSTLNSGFRGGYNGGVTDGFDDGKKEGREEGWEEGRIAGWGQGWDEAVDQANVEIAKQMGFVRQHVADKESMQMQLQEQHRLIGLMKERLDELELQNANLKKGNDGLRDVVLALKQANERMQTELTRLDDKYKARSEEYVDQMFQYNRNMVFMNAVRATLEDFTEKHGSHAKEVREIFAQKYSVEVSNALQRRAIRVAPEMDETFANTLPRTRKFIISMLSKVASNEHPATPVPEREDSHEPSPV